MRWDGFSSRTATHHDQAKPKDSRRSDDGASQSARGDARYSNEGAAGSEAKHRRAANGVVARLRDCSTPTEFRAEAAAPLRALGRPTTSAAGRPEPSDSVFVSAGVWALFSAGRRSKRARAPRACGSEADPLAVKNDFQNDGA